MARRAGMLPVQSILTERFARAYFYPVIYEHEYKRE